ncbi:MAG: DUF5118 domain-containing protein [Butyricimonas paravirosa]
MKNRIYIVVLWWIIFHSVAQQEINAFLIPVRRRTLWRYSRMFTTYRQGTDLWEIPDSLFGRDMLVTTTILESAALKKEKKTDVMGIPGSLWAADCSFSKEVTRFYYRCLSVTGWEWTRERRDSSCGPATGDFMLNGVLPVLVETSSSVLVEVSRLLMNNPLFNLGPFSFVENGDGRK